MSGLIPTTLRNCTTPPGRAWSARASGSEPPIDLDTMLDLTAAAEVDGVKFDGVDLFLFAPHVNIDADRRRAQDAGRQGALARPGDRLGGRAGLAADRRRLGDGRGRGTRRSSSSRSARAAGSPGGSASWACGPTASCGSTRPASPADWAKDPEGNQERIAETFKQAARDRRGPRRAAGRRRGDLLGRHALLADDGRPAGAGRRARDRSASRPTWPTRCSTRWARTPPRTASCRQASTGTTTPTLDERPADADRRPAALDDRLPRRPERRDRLRLGLARPHRPALPAERPQRQARHPPPRRLLAPRRARASSTKAFRHICWDGCMFPNAVDDEARRPGTTSWPR